MLVVRKTVYLSKEQKTEKKMMAICVYPIANFSILPLDLMGDTLMMIVKIKRSTELEICHRDTLPDLDLDFTHPNSTAVS